jgi:transposase InsO family protein
MAGLVDRSKRPRSCPHRIPARAELRVIELRRDHPRWGPRRLAYELARKGTDPVPSRSSIYRILLRSGLVEPRARRRRKADYLRWERARPMERCGSSTSWRRACKRLVREDLDRPGRPLPVLCARPRHAPRHRPSGLQGLRAGASGPWGSPGVVDGQRACVHRRHGRTGRAEVLFDRVCRENGIRHLLTAVRSPTTTGKVERFHRTLRDELFVTRSFSSVAEVQLALDGYVAVYNTLPSHQALGMATPIDLGRHDPRPVRRVDPFGRRGRSRLAPAERVVHAFVRVWGNRRV